MISVVLHSPGSEDGLHHKDKCRLALKQPDDLKCPEQAHCANGLDRTRIQFKLLRQVVAPEQRNKTNHGCNDDEEIELVGEGREVQV